MESYFKTITLENQNHGKIKKSLKKETLNIVLLKCYFLMNLTDLSSIFRM